MKRHGLNPPFRREQLDALERMEIAALAMLRGVRKFRRLGDPPGTYRIVAPSLASISPSWGLTVAVIGYTDGIEDPGLNCRDCPLCDLEPLTGL